MFVFIVVLNVATVVLEILEIRRKKELSLFPYKRCNFTAN